MIIYSIKMPKIELLMTQPPDQYTTIPKFAENMYLTIVLLESYFVREVMTVFPQRFGDRKAYQTNKKSLCAIKLYIKAFMSFSFSAKMNALFIRVYLHTYQNVYRFLYE